MLSLIALAIAMPSIRGMASLIHAARHCPCIQIPLAVIPIDFQNVKNRHDKSEESPRVLTVWKATTLWVVGRQQGEVFIYLCSG